MLASVVDLLRPLTRYFTGKQGGIILYDEIFRLMQFGNSGCENCPFFGMHLEYERVNDCTTSHFSG